MSATALRSALAAMHVDGEIEAHGTVAVLITSRPEQLADADVRSALLDAATLYGFRALAIELSGAASIGES